MQEMSRKNQFFTDSVIRRMTRISIDCGAINLAQGFPDFDPPKAILDRLSEVSYLGPHQYPITMGAPNFRQALARKCGRFMGRTLDPNTDMVVASSCPCRLASSSSAMATSAGDCPAEAVQQRRASASPIPSLTITSICPSRRRVFSRSSRQSVTESPGGGDALPNFSAPLLPIR